MLIVELTYVAPLEQVDALLDEHGEWLEEHFASGVFLAAGRKVPRTGGVILATGVDRERLEQIIADDPFGRAGVAEYRVTEAAPSRFGGALATDEARAALA